MDKPKIQSYLSLKIASKKHSWTHQEGPKVPHASLALVDIMLIMQVIWERNAKVEMLTWYSLMMPHVIIVLGLSWWCGKQIETWLLSDVAPHVTKDEMMM